MLLLLKMFETVRCRFFRILGERESCKYLRFVLKTEACSACPSELLHEAAQFIGSRNVCSASFMFLLRKPSTENETNNLRSIKVIILR